MEEFLRAVGNAISVSVGIIGIILTAAAAFDWALGKAFAYWRSYKILIEYAMHHREFKAWRAKQRSDA